jgi:hypothetical protein
MNTKYNMTILIYSNINNNDLRIIDYDIIMKALIYKQLNPPQYRIYNFDRGYLSTVLSKSVSLIFDVQGIGKIHQHFVYDIKNNIVKYNHWYLSEKKRIENRKQTRKRRFAARYVEDK